MAELFAAVARDLMQRSRRASSEPVSDSRYELLHLLVHHGPLRMGRVAARLGVAARTVTSLVDGLNADGLLRRVPDPSDRRAQLLELTEHGVAFLRERRRERLRAVGRVFAALDDAERAAFAATLERLVAAAVST